MPDTQENLIAGIVAWVALALVAALILSLTFVPAAVAMFITGKVEERENFVMRKAKLGYEPLLIAALRWRWPRARSGPATSR